MPMYITVVLPHWLTLRSNICSMLKTKCYSRVIEKGVDCIICILELLNWWEVQWLTDDVTYSSPLWHTCPSCLWSPSSVIFIQLLCYLIPNCYSEIETISCPFFELSENANQPLLILKCPYIGGTTWGSKGISLNFHGILAVCPFLWHLEELEGKPDVHISWEQVCYQWNSAHWFQPPGWCHQHISSNAQANAFIHLEGICTES